MVSRYGTLRSAMIRKPPFRAPFPEADLKLPTQQVLEGDY
jgi:hypothetical protein